jgi:nucleoid-associated protein YgaU
MDDLTSAAQVTSLPGQGGFRGAQDAGVLAKLTIQYEQSRPRQFTGEVVALFNPSEFTLNHNMTWSAAPSATPGGSARLHFQGDSAQPATLQLALFFDTYASSVPLPGQAPTPLSVTAYTEQVANLIRLDRELHRPPLCRLLWGKLQLMRGVLTTLVQRFTLFHADGTPVRATLDCTFQQYREAELTLKALDLHSADVPKTWTVRRGDTLSSIAAAAYHDPRLWRPIATANGLHNPRALRPGQILRLPTLRPSGEGA